MSHIVTNREELEQLIKIQESIPKGYIDKNALDYLLLHLSPKDENKSLLIDYKVYEDLPFNGCYIPKDRMIIFSVPSVNKWINCNTSDIQKEFDVRNFNLLKEYIVLYPVIHEIEHAYQHMMSIKKIKAPNAKISEGYKCLFDFITNTNQSLFNKFKRLKYMPIYNKNKEDYVLERNANFETATLLTELALFKGDIEMAEVFRNLTYNLVYRNYINDNKGPMFHTFKDLGILDWYTKIKNNNELNMLDNIRYGLEIAEEDRQMLFK